MDINKIGTTSKLSKASISNTVIPDLKAVVVKVLHTRTEIKIYPDGSTYQSSKSWFEGGHQFHQPKRKKKEVKAPKTEVNKVEEW